MVAPDDDEFDDAETADGERADGPIDDEFDEAAFTQSMERELPEFELTPAEHQRLKRALFTEDWTRLGRFEERYFVCGSGSDDAAGARRELATDRLEARAGATAFRLEDFGLTGADLDLWWRAFDILCGRATTIAVVLEDFHGGYASEMAYLWTPEYRDRTWLLMRIYADEATMRERYDDPMARSCAIAFDREGRRLEWTDPAGFLAVLERVP